MTKKHFYIFRHGHTDMNIEGRQQGQSNDTILNESGKKQAQQLVEELTDIKLDVIYTSPLKRSFETGKMVADSKNIEIIKEDRLMAANFGEGEGMLRSEMRPEELEQHLGVSPNFKFKGGETQVETATRTMAALKDIAENTDYENIGISTHGENIRFILSHEMGIPTGFGVKFAKPFHFIYENGNWEIIE